MIIHAGVHRTGTSYLQSVLDINRKNLRQLGILYPKFDRSPNHNCFAKDINEKKDNIMEWVNLILNEMGSDTDTVIISAENLCESQSYDWLLAMQMFFDVELVIYLRRQDSWLESWYNQNIKWPWNNKFKSCTGDFFFNHRNDFHWLDYAKLLGDFSNVLGPDKIYIGVVENSGITDTTADFSNKYKLNLIMTASQKNESLTYAQIQILRHLDIILLDMDWVAKAKIISVLQNLEIEEDDGSFYIFNDNQRALISNEFLASNILVAEKYFSRDYLFKDPIPANIKPVMISNSKIHTEYIPSIVRELAKSQK